MEEDGLFFIPFSYIKAAIYCYLQEIIPIDIKLLRYIAMRLMKTVSKEISILFYFDIEDEISFNNIIQKNINNVKIFDVLEDYIVNGYDNTHIVSILLNSEYWEKECKTLKIAKGELKE